MFEKKTQKYLIYFTFQISLKNFPAQKVSQQFFDPPKNSIVCSAFNSP